MTPGMDKTPDRTPDQAREEIARKDRQGWFAAGHASGAFGIISGRSGFEVARSDSREYRDMILTMAKSHDALVAALDLMVCFCIAQGWQGKGIDAGNAALVLARGATVLKTADELASHPGGVR